ncbi:MAG: hypothetical protein CMC79_02075 [Flavobacteriaceae bacterium]|nr:hypothetical protein [Flavobacteriaceae bacterium]|tara:strand:+ start:486 stop:845 length:360 start_codon:yes stop_codon:yes gene_type:complete
MPFINRLSYYLIGFSLGILILAFILNGKKTSCNYGPEARVKSELLKKEVSISQLNNDNKEINSEIIKNFIKNSNVDFSQSNTTKDSCKTYTLKGYLKSEYKSILLENCSKKVNILRIDN